MCSFCKEKHKGAGKGCLRRKVNAHLRPKNWTGEDIDEWWGQGSTQIVLNVNSKLNDNNYWTPLADQVEESEETINTIITADDKENEHPPSYRLPFGGNTTSKQRHSERRLERLKDKKKALRERISSTSVEKWQKHQRPESQFFFRQPNRRFQQILNALKQKNDLEIDTYLSEHNIATLKTNAINLIQEGISSVEEVYALLID